MNRTLILACLIMILIPSVIAIDVNIKSSYSPGETIISEITGVLTDPIAEGDIIFQRDGHVQVPLEYGLEKINSKYYIWAIAPMTENNYTLLIKKVHTLLNGVANITEYKKEFAVKGKIVDYSVSPGAIFTTKDFYVSYTLNKDTPLDVAVNLNDTRSITLQPGKNKVLFSIESIKRSNLNYLQIGMYQIPVYIKVNDTMPVTNIDMTFSPRLIGVSFLERREAKVGIVNLGSENLRNINLEYDSNILSIDPSSGINISSGETVYVTIKLKEGIKNISTDVFARATGISAVLSIDASVNASNPSEIKKAGYYCSELQGKVCTTNQFCAGDLSNSLDGSCCVGDCVEKKNTSSGGYGWIGWILLIGIIIVAYFIWRKYSKIKSEKEPVKRKLYELEKLEKQSKK